MKLPAIVHRFSSPKNFYTMSGKLVPWLTWGFILTLFAGLYYGLFVAPPDYQQGESYRIMFVHVPAAWMSMFIYMVMAFSAVVGLIWRIKTADLMASVSAPIGAAFTFLALVTGSLWGKPMWGTYWVWDARLTSELVLLFLYLGFIALQASIEDPRNASRAGALLLIVGVVNIPIIHYSVEWWSTLHQGATVTKIDKPSIHISMLIPLLLMAVSFKLYYGASVLMRARGEILRREQNTRWVKEVVAEESA
ncbi:Cytochrome c-type biogenesis protein CcmC, putative heme lyase for CcmE [hydrothermal vent metagenome]|uniref:Cytochrome c-type biogenesis protein CcmC, putative heme lyase for CcmE n=1 Tax=hydrothermal vent metagenome TaxID=652676 RepID=A0A3B0XJR1_9ZZZZ